MEQLKCGSWVVVLPPCTSGLIVVNMLHAELERQMADQSGLHAGTRCRDHQTPCCGEVQQPRVEDRDPAEDNWQ